MSFFGLKVQKFVNFEQLLNLNHLEYTISFIDEKIKILDEVMQSSDVGEAAESPPSSPGIPNIPTTHTHLGSGKEATTIASFADGSTGNGLTFTSFRKMLETFLNKFYQTHQLPQESYLEVHGDTKVKS